MKTITREEIKDVKDLRRAIRGLADFEILHIVGWGQVQKISKNYAICGEQDDSDPYRDYDAWSYGLKLSWVVDYVKSAFQLA